MTKKKKKEEERTQLGERFLHSNTWVVINKPLAEKKKKKKKKKQRFQRSAYRRDNDGFPLRWRHCVV